MIRQELNKKSPIRILESSTHGGVGKKNIGVFAAKRGEGKTACLVHFALDALLRNRKVLHITFSENPDHIYSWYENIFSEMAKAYHLEAATEVHDEISAHRMILNFNLKTMPFDHVKARISTVLSDLKFSPEVIIVDGYDTAAASPEDFGEFKILAEQHDAELWFAFTIAEESPSTENKIPEALEKFSAFISVIILLETVNKKIMLKLLRDHDRNVMDDPHLRLNPTTLLIEE